MITIVPTVLVQLVATYMFYERHWKSVSRNMSSSLVGEVHYLVKEVSGDIAFTKRDELLNKAHRYLGLNSKFNPGETLSSKRCTSEFSSKETCSRISLPSAYQTLEENLKKAINLSLVVDVVEETEDILIKIKLPDGVLSIIATDKRLTNPTTYIFIMWMSGTALILLLVAILFIKNQVRSITRLARAAEKFGKGEDVERYKPQGAEEVRRAANAFLDMKDRIQRHLTQRMEMLAGISHDLRTPLTRMKLQLAMLEDSKTSKTLEKDVDEMEMMLSEYLDFLRGAGQEEKRKTKLSNILKEITESYHKPEDEIVLRVGKDGKLDLRPLAFKRCIINIINNGLRYGSRVVISADFTKDHARIALDDNGPGIPPEKYKDVMKPFVRLDQSRNEDTGGAGLGLAIVRDIINSHGGEITLDESALGGLRVLITIPV